MQCQESSEDKQPWRISHQCRAEVIIYIILEICSSTEESCINNLANDLWLLEFCYEPKKYVIYLLKLVASCLTNSQVLY